MARHQVPQFIEVEDKIFGPLSFKQFIYLLGGAGFTFIMFRVFPLFLALLFAAPVIALSLSLAFYKINSKPFIFTLEAGFKYIMNAKLYIWKKEPKKQIPKTPEEVGAEIFSVPKLSESKLDDLAWGLDIKEKVEE
ncbi:hypothetical protein COV42_01970 [Candidatus Campbellbacteria bacterium CG11_big_fil_rev_8_21_14_0_20_44_21]|uniref:PrgI family protein n=1 Tax=Candidatus Campbellbacteria bacterium CG22_combo_CG10-13_8_21_14_all_43_18 TaxID=1974530 RepID=A0A2H0DW20_9BACT|nr:MAG: hypothetical protein COW82_02505 [Candidatus Campbellbacteria bacterium CG22_combo_CG10-13_8_21_14_all_43_18]PIR24194.1 MAG: hypothetical protein COV42_01970 [Candidatus Campbellbacteria bacterium CG11_big_fil_rev_8_21_14_0_20_44_21]